MTFCSILAVWYCHIFHLAPECKNFVWLCRQKTVRSADKCGKTNRLLIRYEIEVEYNISIPCKLKIRSVADFVLITEGEFWGKVSAAWI